MTEATCDVCGEQLARESFLAIQSLWYMDAEHEYATGICDPELAQEQLDVMNREHGETDSGEMHGTLVHRACFDMWLSGLAAEMPSRKRDQEGEHG